MPSLEEHYKKKPADYLSHLIGHESDGSILALLKEKGWATELLSGPKRTTKDHEVTYSSNSLAVLKLIVVCRYLKLESS